MITLGRTAVCLVRATGASVLLPTVLRAGPGRACVGRGVGSQDDGATPPTVSVVVPARNEADRIAPLLRGVVGAPGVIETIVVDDGSTDDTALVAASLGATVVGAGRPPPGWLGKPWALDVGVRRARGEWVVLLDADVRVDTDLPRLLVARAAADGVDLLSAAGSFRLGPWATWLHASMLATLVMRFGAPSDRVITSPDRTLVNGQCMVMRRVDLVDAGGWAAVAHRLVEDVALARSLVARGRRVTFVDASDRMVVEPYSGVWDVWLGWGRSIGLPGVEPRRRIIVHAAAIAAVSVLPLVRLVRRRFDVFDLALLGVRVGLAVGLRPTYAPRGPATTAAVVGSPVADVLAVAAVGQAAVRRRVRWRGRSVPVHRVSLSGADPDVGSASRRRSSARP